MSRIFSQRPSPALVVACIALLVALGGTAVAATKLVSGDRLVKKHSLSGNRLRNQTITGTQVRAGTLGKVPSATGADSATTAVTATNADSATTAVTATNAKALGGTPASAFACPSGTELLAGTCIETTARPSDTWSNDSKTCAAVGRHLPTADQLAGIALNGQLTWSGDDRTSDVYYTGTFHVTVVSGSGALGDGLVTNAGPYRCAVNPVP